MKVGEVARRLRVTPQAVRFYEARGLLPAPARASNEYREYSMEDYERLRLLVGLRRLDMPLNTAAMLAVACIEGRCDETAAELRVVIRERRAQISERIAELHHVEAELARLDDLLADGANPQDAIASEANSNGV